MSFLFDALKNLLATDAATRREGLRGMIGRALGVEPLLLLRAADRPYDAVHYRKTPTRPFAVTMTVGLAELEGRELVALTLADAKPGEERYARMIAAAAATPRGAVVRLPDGLLGRSAHAAALVTEAWPIPDRAEHERIVGGTLDLVVPVTEREAAWIAAHGSEAFVARMKAQAIAPFADRPAGETRLEP
jgi:hypothetical protein